MIMSFKTTGVALTAFSLLALGGAAGGAHAQAAEVPTKPPGVTRIGIVRPQVELGEQNDADAADGVRALFADYLQGPTIEVALLDARLPSQYAIEAEQADCDFVIVASLELKRSRLNAAFGKALENIAWRAPRLSSSSTTSVIVSSVLSSAADFASSIKAKDEVELAFRLSPLGAAAPIVEDTVKRRAKSDGEDLVTPAVESAAVAIGAAVAVRL
jgi:hypothetical protein